jgi:hypothetical protein
MSDDDGGFRRDDPDTSRDAAGSFSASHREASVFKTIFEAGTDGANWWEIHKRNGMLMQTISPAFAPLCRKGYIKAKTTIDDVVIKRPGESGRGQTVWIAIRNMPEPLDVTTSPTSPSPQQEQPSEAKNYFRR